MSPAFSCHVSIANVVSGCCVYAKVGMSSFHRGIPDIVGSCSAITDEGWHFLEPLVSAWRTACGQDGSANAEVLLVHCPVNAQGLLLVT